ncbi:unnamed protein product, partial [Ectocarpus sp. 12 AP-2014]
MVSLASTPSVTSCSTPASQRCKPRLLLPADSDDDSSVIFTAPVAVFVLADLRVAVLVVLIGGVLVAAARTVAASWSSAVLPVRAMAPRRFCLVVFFAVTASCRRGFPPVSRTKFIFRV